MKKEISSPLLEKTIEQLETIHEQVRKREINIDEATARITAIKHKIQAVALDWLYSKKLGSLVGMKRKSLELE